MFMKICTNMEIISRVSEDFKALKIKVVLGRLTFLYTLS